MRLFSILHYWEWQISVFNGILRFIYLILGYPTIRYIMLSTQISCRSKYSNGFIYLMRFIRYLETGKLLHVMCVSGVFLFFVFMEKTTQAISNKNWFAAIVHGYFTLYFFTLPFFSELDARSRYQNYKILKDKLHVYGFDERILKPFILSRCQRDAIKTAAKDLNFGKEFDVCIRKMGFRWYHILPQLVVKNPKLLFSKNYWQKTLFVKAYTSKYFLW